MVMIMIEQVKLSNDLSFVEFKNQCLQGYEVYVKPGVYALSSRKIESLINIAYVQKYYQCNPVRFISDWFNIELLDAQAWIITQSWNCPNVLLLCTRGFGKSTLIDLMLMAKDMLFNNYWSFIASGSSAQAQNTFTTLERLANNNIDTMVGSTGELFKAELVIPNANGDGFSHNPDGFKYTLNNGAMTMTLNSNIDRKRGLRGNVIFDEGAFLSEEMLTTYSAFAIVNKSFKSGKDRDGNLLDMNRIRSIPDEIPNQLFYISSASSTDMEYYRIYRDFSKRMIIGDPNFFVAQIPCDIVFKPTIHGKPVAPLLEKSTVDAAMRQNKYKALREYYCQFSTEGSENAIIKRSAIIRNELTYKPVLYNDNGKRNIVICYDPARSRDNSVILVGEVYQDKDINGDIEYKGRLLNCINLIDVGKKRKSPMQTPDQVEYLKEIILAYNAGGDENYSNILGIYIDAGSGGGGVNIADYLMEDWIGKDGKIHKGLIDKEYSSDYVKKFPNAVDKVHLMSPTKYKSEMYEAMIEMVNQNKVTFTASYDGKGYLTIFNIDEEVLKEEKEKIAKKLKSKKLSIDEYENRMSEELSKIQSVNTKTVKLDWDEEAALSGIDALKEEIVNMVRIKRDSGKDSFELTPEKRNSLNDDRSYCMSMFGYALQQERRKNITSKRKTAPDSVHEFVNSLPIKRGTRMGFGSSFVKM